MPSYSSAAAVVVSKRRRVPSSRKANMGGDIGEELTSANPRGRCTSSAGKLLELKRGVHGISSQDGQDATAEPATSAHATVRRSAFHEVVSGEGVPLFILSVEE